MDKKPKAVEPIPVRKWTTTQALREAEKVGISMTLPTLIKLCTTYGVGYQITERGHWRVYADAFMNLIKGELDK